MYERMNIEDWKAKKKNDRDAVLADQKQALQEVLQDGADLTAYLLGQMDADGRVDPGCSMTELAARLNMGRASLYRELQKLEERGALTRSGKAILIQKPELLRH